jgi:hypothetical protein
MNTEKRRRKEKKEWRSQSRGNPDSQLVRRNNGYTRATNNIR